MKKSLLLMLLVCVVGSAQNPETAVFPGAVATDKTLFVAANSATATLSAAITTTSQTAFATSSTAAFLVPTVVKVGDEIIAICSKGANLLTACTIAADGYGGRGFSGTTAATHLTNATLTGIVDRGFHNRGMAEIQAIETKLAAEMVSVKDFGAACDGTTDAAPAIRLAQATGRSIYFPGKACSGPYLVNSFAGTYSNNSWVFILTGDNQTFYSDEGATIKMADGLVNSGGQTFGGGMFLLNGTSGVRLTGLTLDMNGLNNLVPSGTIRNAIAIKGVTVTSGEVDNLRIVNSSGQNAIAFDTTSSGLKIHDNSISIGGTALAGNTYQTDWSAIYTEADHSDVVHNRIDNSDATNSTNGYPRGPAGGIEVHGSYSLATGNDISYGFPCVYVDPIDYVTVQTDTAITENRCSLAYSGITMSKGYATGIGIGLNNIELRSGAWPVTVTSVYASYGVWQFSSATYPDVFHRATNSRIYGNIIREVEASTPATPVAQGIAVADFSSSSIDTNILSGTSGESIAINGTGYGLHDLIVHHNSISDFGQNSSDYSHYGVRLDLSGDYTGCVAPCSSYGNLENVRIYDNPIVLTTPSSTAIPVYLNWDLSNSVIANLDIRDNPTPNAASIGGPAASTYQTNRQLRALVEGRMSFTALSIPGSVTVAPTCDGTCASTWGYKVAAFLEDGTTSTEATAEVTTAAQAATLTAGRYNTISWNPVVGATFYRVYRATSGGAPASIGLFSCITLTATSCKDDGSMSAASGAAPTVNITGTVAAVRLGLGTSSPAVPLHNTGISYLIGPVYTDLIQPYSGTDLALGQGSTARITVNGGLTLSTNTEPTCETATRGLQIRVAGGIGVADTYRICAKSSSDTYGWISAQETPTALTQTSEYDAANALSVSAGASGRAQVQTPLRVDPTTGALSTPTITTPTEIDWRFQIGALAAPGTNLTKTGVNVAGVPVWRAFGGSETPFVGTIFSGSQALGTTEIAANACATTIDVAATGVVASDRITLTESADWSAITGYGAAGTDGLLIYKWPDTGYVHIKVCNGTGTAITPGAATVNVGVVR